VAYDGSDVSKHAIEYLRRLQLPATAKISLLSLVRRPENLPDEVVYDPKQLEDSRKELESLRAALMADSSANVEVVVAESRHLAHAIVEFASRNHSALVVVGDKGRSAIARFFLGSVSRSVLHHAPCSVLVVKRRS
jgi:nucleotide-binding universal stress UspA family protein